MKKIIAIAMALIMMMAVTVPAFADEISDTSTEKAGEALVKTDTTAVGAGTYTVTYPAEIIIDWNKDVHEETYSVNTQLAVGKSLNVSVADSATNTLVGVMTANGTADELTYDLAGDTSVDYVEVSNETETLTFTVRDWNKTIAEYSNKITFTVALSDI